MTNDKKSEFIETPGIRPTPKRIWISFGRGFVFGVVVRGFPRDFIAYVDESSWYVSHEGTEYQGICLGMSASVEAAEEKMRELGIDIGE